MRAHLGGCGLLVIHPFQVAHANPFKVVQVGDVPLAAVVQDLGGLQADGVDELLLGAGGEVERVAGAIEVGLEVVGGGPPQVEVAVLVNHERALPADAAVLALDGLADDPAVLPVFQVLRRGGHDVAPFAVGSRHGGVRVKRPVVLEDHHVAPAGDRRAVADPSQPPG